MPASARSPSGVRAHPLAGWRCPAKTSDGPPGCAPGHAPRAVCPPIGPRGGGVAGREGPVRNMAERGRKRPCGPVGVRRGTQGSGRGPRGGDGEVEAGRPGLSCQDLRCRTRRGDRVLPGWRGRAAGSRGPTPRGPLAGLGACRAGLFRGSCLLWRMTPVACTCSLP